MRLGVRLALGKRCGVYDPWVAQFQWMMELGDSYSQYPCTHHVIL